MKFSQVELGQRFIFQGETYTKSSPVIATAESNGEKKFFKRADNIQLPDLPDTVAIVESDNALENVQQAFERFHQAVLNELTEHVDAELYEKLDNKISEHARAFSQALKK